MMDRTEDIRMARILDTNKYVDVLVFPSVSEVVIDPYQNKPYPADNILDRAQGF